MSTYSRWHRCSHYLPVVLVPYMATLTQAYFCIKYGRKFLPQTNQWQWQNTILDRSLRPEGWGPFEGMATGWRSRRVTLDGTRLCILGWGRRAVGGREVMRLLVELEGAIFCWVLILCWCLKYFWWPLFQVGVGTWLMKVVIMIMTVDARSECRWNQLPSSCATPLLPLPLQQYFE